MPKLLSIYLLILLIISQLSLSLPISQQKSISPGVGYRIGKAQDYKKLKSSFKSTLYQIISSQLDDGRPMKLLDLHGSHYQIGFDYGYMLADQIQYSYNSLFNSQISNKQVKQIMQMFLSWQYRSFVRKQIPLQFLEEIKGIKDGAFKAKKIKNINKKLERVLVISNFPGALGKDIPAVLFDQFLKDVLHIRNQKIENYIQTNLLYVIHKMQKFIKKFQIMCSFFGVWGSRTLNGQLYTMRNLDWAANTGINLNKLVIIYNIDDSIPHATLGFPGLIGALTGISAKGITVHEAGQSSQLQSMSGFQWTLRMRYIMMKSNNLSQALQYWNSTKNTLGMNFMIGSAVDKKAVVLQTMRGYTALFNDNDPRQNHTIFTDKNDYKYVAGFSMPDAIFRTNHAYDPTIKSYSINKFISKKDDSMIRYFILKDSFNSYNDQNISMTYQQAINITAILGDKGSQKFYSCQNNMKGENIISVTYQPKELLMWVAFQYGTKESFRSACCGVYVKVDLKSWFNVKDNINSEIQK